MPSRRTSLPGGTSGNFAKHEMAIGDLAMDITSERPSAPDGTATIVIGRDVLKAGRLSRHPGRARIATSGLSPTDLPLIETSPSDMHGNVYDMKTYTSGPREVDAENFTTYKNLYVYKRPLAVGLSPNFVWIGLTPLGDGLFDPIELEWNELDPKPTIIFGDSSKYAPKELSIVGTLPVANTTLFGISEDQFTNTHLAAQADDPRPAYKWWMQPVTDTNGVNIDPGRGDFYDGFQFSVRVEKYYDKRGLWVTNGTRIWLLQGGQYIPYLEVPPEEFGPWKGTQISPWVFMFTHPNGRPRVIRLDQPPLDSEFTMSEVQNRASLAGLYPPDTDDKQDKPGLTFRDVYSSPTLATELKDPTVNKLASSSKTGITMPKFDQAEAYEDRDKSRFAILARVVDDRTGAASRFTPVRPAHVTIDGTTHTYKKAFSRQGLFLEVDWQGQPATNESDDAFFLVIDHASWNYGRSFQISWTFFAVLFDPRATHIEFWRTTSFGGTFHLEMRKRLWWKSDEHLPRQYDGPGPVGTFNEGAPLVYPLEYLYSTSLSGFDTDAIFLGNANNSQWYLQDSDFWSKDHAALGMSDYELQAGTAADAVLLRTGGLPPICKEFISLGGVTIAGGRGTRSSEYDVDWPALESDHLIRYSELELVNPITGLPEPAPESFERSSSGRAVQRLGRSTDSFQAFTQCGDSAIAVMRRGAHRISRDNVSFLTVRRLGEEGVGTPWPLSAVSVGSRACWATPTGIRMYDPDADEGHGQLSLIDAPSVRGWLEDASRLGMEIDSGYDDTSGTLMLRRHMSPGYGDSGEAGAQKLAGRGLLSSSQIRGVREGNRFHVDTLCVNLGTGIATILEGVTGFRFFNATHVEAVTREVSHLYSIDTDGNVWRENTEPRTSLYDGLTLVGSSDDERFNITALSIYDFQGGFSTLLRGDVVWLRNTATGEIESRKIANDSDASRIQWTQALPAPAPGGENAVIDFFIGRSPFVIRWAPFMGSGPNTIKTLDSLAIDCKPGRRNGLSNGWSYPPDGKISVKLYRNVGDLPVATEANGIGIFDESQADIVTTDEYANIEGQGNRMEVEMSILDPRTDAVVASAEARYREEGDEVEDTATTS